jgi:plasmid maintenance system antidote protein VapI
LEITLRGLVLSKFHTINDFSEAIGWKRTKAWRIVNEKQKPTDIEMTQLAKCLNMNVETFLNIFFPQLFTMCTKKEKAG